MESNNYKQIDALKRELENLPTINDEQREKLWKKFRLEWNYNSNHIEGNTLTYGQTELLLIFGKTSGGKDLQEYDEMKAHDLAIKMVTEEARDRERPLTENFVRLLNGTILVRPFWKEALTPDGQTTRREILIGQYKSMPNSVRLANGEIFHYASPQETPALMHDLVKWYNSQLKLHPVELAALFHYKFVRIHPFDDGNGRVARLLMNYILLKYDYPPVIIKSEDKANYLLALNRADSGDEGAFVDYIAEQLAWSLDLSIRATKGENIEEVKDWKKKLTLLKRNLSQDSDIDLYRKDKNVKRVVSQIIIPMLEKIVSDLNDFSELFEKSSIKLYSRNSGVGNLVTQTWKGLMAVDENIEEIRLTMDWNTFKKNKLKTFNVGPLQVKCIFSNSHYIIQSAINNITLEKLYNEFVTTEEQEQITAGLGKHLFETIESNLKAK